MIYHCSNPTCSARLASGRSALVVAKEAIERLGWRFVFVDDDRPTLLCQRCADLSDFAGAH